MRAFHLSTSEKLGQRNLISITDVRDRSNYHDIIRGGVLSEMSESIPLVNQ